MLRILFFVVLVFAIGLGFAWLADRPGDLVVTFGGYQYQVTLMVAAVAVTALVAAVMAGWWLIKAIWYSPHTISRYFRVRRRDRGYQALSAGMIAAGAGDASLARKKKKEAMKLISSDQEPLIHLLDAQASLLEGDHEAARRKFEAMLADPEMRLLGLRGLYLEAERLGDRTASRHYAARAAEVAPQLTWAADATLEQKASDGEWDEALRLVEAQRSTRQVDREAASRRRAVLLTSKAMDLLPSDPAGAKTAALEAHRLAPDLAPAAVTAAKALFRQNDLRKGSKVLEASWRIEPHPELAEAYIHARPGDSTHDRLARAKKLRSLRGNNLESSLAVARAALDAGEFSLARSEAETALRLGKREGAYLLMADIEEAETGDQGRVRQWLGMAVRAPRDPTWIADGYVSDRWMPVSPITGRLDAFQWRSPAERLGPLLEHPETPEPLALTVAPPVVEQAPVFIETQEAEPVSEAPQEHDGDAVVPEDVDAAHIEPADEPEPEKREQQGPAVVAPAPVMDVPARKPSAAAAPALPRMPDDPGVDVVEEQADNRRFRLF